MKTMYTSNEALLEILAEHGIEIVCNEQMEMTISDEDADRIPAIVAQYAPAAADDYAIETPIEEMEKELYLRRSEASSAAENFASEHKGAYVYESRMPVADDRTDFDYVDRDMNTLGAWSGELSGYIVRNASHEDVGIFAYWDSEL